MTAKRPAARRRAGRPAQVDGETLDADVAALMTVNADLQRLNIRQHKALWRDRKLSERGMYALELIHAGLDRPGRLVEYFDVLPSTITFETDKLVAAGLLVRETDPDDRRAIRLRLTEAGRAVHREVTSAINTLLRPRIDRLTREEFDAFMATFRKLLAES